MKKDIKLTYLKKAKKFLDKNQNILNENQADELIVKVVDNNIIIEAIIEDIGFRGNIYK